MKAIPVIAALFAFVWCAQVAESSGWEELVAHKDSQKELRATPTITVQKAVLNTNSATVVLLLENRTGVDLEYYGYGKERPQLFYKEKRDGKWVASIWDWCGTGIERYVVKNRKIAAFELHIPAGRFQVFAIFRNARDPKEFSLIKLYEKDGG